MVSYQNRIKTFFHCALMPFDITAQIDGLAVLSLTALLDTDRWIDHRTGGFRQPWFIHLD
jgi:hypothetical protein